MKVAATVTALLIITMGGLIISSQSSASIPPLPEYAPNMRFLTMRSPDMYCGGCEWSVENALEPIPGILYADADLETKEVHIIYDPERITSDQILSQSIFDTYGREFVSDVSYTPASL